MWSLSHKMLPRLRSEPPSGKHRESERRKERVPLRIRSEMGRNETREGKREKESAKG